MRSPLLRALVLAGSAALAAGCSPDRPSQPLGPDLAEIGTNAGARCTAGTAIFNDNFTTAILSPNWSVVGGTWKVASGILTGQWPLAAAQTDQGNLLLASALYPIGNFEVVSSINGARPSTKFVFYLSAGTKYNFNFDRRTKTVNAEFRTGGSLYQNRLNLNGARGFHGTAVEDTIAVRRVGGAVQVAVNRVVVGEFLDPAFAGAGRVGLGAYGTMKYDWFTLCAPPKLPVSNRIAFGSTRSGSEDLYAVNPDGSGLLQLSTDPGNEERPRWSPAGFRLVYLGQGSNGSYEVFVVNADGTGRKALTSNTGDDTGPSWAPDGSRIVFERRPVGGVYKLYTMNPDGSNAVQLAGTSVGVDEYSADWSPDGARIVFSSTTGASGSNIWVANADGSQAALLAAGASFAGTPKWSPDGTRVVFQKSPGGGRGDIWVINADGTGEVQLTSGTMDGSPNWSPDGSQIIFEHGFVEQLFTINPDGSNQVQLMSSTSRDYHPDWH